MQLIDKGEAGLRNIIRAANDTGAVIDEQLIQRAAEVDARFNAIAATVGSTLKGAIVSAADSLAEFIEGFRAFENQATGTLQKKQADLGLKRLDLENQSLASGGSDRLSTRRRAVIEQQLRDLAAEESQVVDALNNRLKVQPMQRSGPTWTPPTAPPGGFGPIKTGGRSGSSAKSEADAVRDLIEQLDYEYSLIGKTELEKEKMNAIRQAGANATASERAAIEAKVESIYSETNALDAAKSAAEEARSAAQDFAGGIVDAFINGENAADALRNSIKRLASQLADQALSALFGGGGGGILSAIFPFANGGVAAHGKPLKTFARGGVSNSAAIFGEAGPEAAVPLPDGRSIPVKFQQPSVPKASSAAAGSRITNNYTIDARGADQAAVARLERGLAERDATESKRVAGYSQRSQVRKTRP